jgi:hypothetical protein
VTDESPPKTRRGCLFYGCLTGTVCLVAILLALLLGLHELKKMVALYTDPAPMALPAVQMAPEQIEQVQRRIDAFKDAVRTGRTTPPLELNADEINALIASDPKLRQVKGKLYVTMQDSHLKGQISLPLPQLGLPVFKNRYLNGTASFLVTLQNGNLSVSPDAILVKGKLLPWVYMNKLRSQNLAANVNEDPHASVALNRLQSIQIKDGKLVLVPKPLE